MAKRLTSKTVAPPKLKGRLILAAPFFVPPGRICLYSMPGTIGKPAETG